MPMLLLSTRTALSHPSSGVSTSDHLLDLASGDLPGCSREESQSVLVALRDAFRDRRMGEEDEVYTGDEDRR